MSTGAIVLLVAVLGIAIFEVISLIKTIKKRKRERAEALAKAQAEADDNSNKEVNA